MNKIYSVTINGRTMESRNLRELLARAVNAKRNLCRGKGFESQFHKKISTENAAGSCPESKMAIAQ